MNSRTHWLCPLLFLAGVLACDVSSLASTALPTPTPTLIRSSTPAGDKLVLGKEYGIKVSFPIKEQRVPVDPNDIWHMQHQVWMARLSQPIYPDPGQVLFSIKAEFFRRGTNWDDWFPTEGDLVSVIDSKGAVYMPHLRPAFSGPGNWFQEEVDGWAAGRNKIGALVYEGLVIYFSVPDTNSGFKLRYRDLPLIDLEPVR